MSLILNDVHSQLNATHVREIHRPQTLEELIQIVTSARESGSKISVAGGYHAMGGQQFAHDSIHLDMRECNHVLGCDPSRGLLHIQAGAQWPEIIAATHRMTHRPGKSWAIRQKQTGVDAVTLGGSISANAHGRGLSMQPIGDDIEDLTVINAAGECILCSRTQHAELFSLVIGGYGLFGIIYSATLRLTHRLRVRRRVDIIDLDDALHAVFRRVNDGCIYGDFQFVIDTQDDGFLRRGVFACYQPVETEIEESTSTADLTPDAWLKLLKLAHDDKSTAFKLYAQHYLSTDGNLYWSDTMQLSTYIPSYADFLESTRSTAAETSAVKETLVIGEHYVPREKLLGFMQAAREIFKSSGSEVIYGTIRSIHRDTVSFLPWAKGDFVCIIFNLRTRHCPDGMQQTAETFQALIDAANHVGGSFFLTYHRHASATQVETSYPEFRNWLALKLHYDPSERWVSDWYLHYRNAFAEQATHS